MERRDILKELNVEKLNICESDGTVKMALFNGKSMPPVIIDGEDILPGHRKEDNTPGILFYDVDGVECGGLIFGGKEGHGMSFTMDKKRQDQVIQICSDEGENGHTYGIRIYDRPDCSVVQTLEMMKEFEQMPCGGEKEKKKQELLKNNYLRLSMGKKADGSVGIEMFDSKGKRRMQFMIDKEDNPHVEVVDKDGTSHAVKLG